MMLSGFTMAILIHKVSHREWELRDINRLGGLKKLRPKLESIIRVISMELVSTLILEVAATGGSTNLNINKGSEQANILMEQSNIVNTKTEENMGTELS